MINLGKNGDFEESLDEPASLVWENISYMEVKHNDNNINGKQAKLRKDGWLGFP